MRCQKPKKMYAFEEMIEKGQHRDLSYCYFHKKHLIFLVQLNQIGSILTAHDITSLVKSLVHRE